MGDVLATPIDLARRRDLRASVGAAARAAPAVSSGLAVVGVAAGAGAYFGSTWGSATLAFLWAAAVGIVIRRVRVDRMFSLFVGAAAAVAGWSASSALWGASGAAVAEVERTLVYVSALLALAVVVGRRRLRQFVGGVTFGAGAVAAYALLTRLFPGHFASFDSIAVYRLEAPIGYWNGLGILATLGALLAAGFAARGRRAQSRVLAAAALVAVMPTIYFTFSRGSWIALAVGIGAAIALDARRLQLATTLLVVSPAPAVAVWLASRSHALTTQQSSIAAAAHEGKRLALWILVLAATNAAVAAAFVGVERRVVVPRIVRVAYATVLAAAVAAALLGAFVHYGSPPTVVRKTWHAFNAPPPRTNGNLNNRLFNLSGNGRVQLWKAAWRDFEAHPWVGSGAGTYQEYWLQHRSTNLYVKDAHNLYLEMLAEGGVAGFGLLAVMLSIPLVAAFRARRHPLVPAIFGAYVAYLVHAAVDWDWEVPAVTLTALLCGAALVIAARKDAPPRPLSPRVRAGTVAVVVALGVFAFVGLVGNAALGSSANAAATGDWKKAAAQARKASWWAPWSSQALQQLGEAEFALRHDAAARATFRKALAKDPRSSELWWDLSGVTRGAAQSRALGRAVRLDPFSFVYRLRRRYLGSDAPRDVVPK